MAWSTIFIGLYRGWTNNLVNFSPLSTNLFVASSKTKPNLVKSSTSRYELILILNFQPFFLKYDSVQQTQHD